MSNFGVTYKDVTIARAYEIPRGRILRIEEPVLGKAGRVEYVSRQMEIRGIRDYGDDIFSIENAREIVVVRGQHDARYATKKVLKPVRVAISHMTPIEGRKFECLELRFDNESAGAMGVGWIFRIRGNTRYYGNGVFTVNTKRGVFIVKTFPGADKASLI